MVKVAVVVVALAVLLHAQPTFRSAVDLVTIQVSVNAKDSGRVGELGPGDFRIYEDGIAQDVSVVSHEPKPLSLCVLLDSSPSMAGREGLATRAIDTILKELDDDDEVALVMFAAKSKIGLPWTPAPRARSFSWYGWRLSLGTALIDALKEALALMETARNALPVIVIVSDGGENSSGTSLAKLVSSRRQSETAVYGIRTERAPSKTLPPVLRILPPDYLPDLVGDSGGAIFRASDPQVAAAAALALLEDLRSQYTVGYVPKRPMDGRYRGVKIETPNPALVLRYREGYLAR